MLEGRSPIVVDTDVIYYRFKGDTRAALHLPELTGKISVVSFMTIAEIFAWVDQRKAGAGNSRFT